MKLDSKMKKVNEALNEAVITAFDATERKKKENERKADSRELNKQLIRQEGILNRNKDLLTPEEYEFQKKAIEGSRSFRETMDKHILNKVNVYAECSSAVLKYINASKEVSSTFGDIVLDIKLHNKESTKLFKEYILEAKNKGYFCEELYSKDFGNNVLDKRESYLMHNEAFKFVSSRIHNSGNEIAVTESPFFIHFDPRVEKQFYDLDQNKKIEYFKKLAEEKNNNKEYFGLGRIAASRTLGGRALNSNETPDIQFREDLVSYLEELVQGTPYQNNTLNIKTSLKEDGKELDLLLLAKKDISEFYEVKKIKQSKKRTLR